MLIWYRGFQCNSLWIHSYCRYRIQLAGIQEQHHNEKQSQTVSTHRGGESNGCWYWLCGSTLSNQTYQHIDSERPSRRKQIKEKPRAKSWNKKGAGIIKKVQWESIFILAESVWATEQRFPLTRKGKEIAGLVRAARDPCRWQRRSSELKTTVTQSNNPNTPHQFLISSIRINYEAEGNLCTLCLRLPTGLIKNWMLEN